jgi:hypothetical protein
LLDKVRGGGAYCGMLSTVGRAEATAHGGLPMAAVLR